MEKSLLVLNGFVPLVVGITMFVLFWVIVINTLKKVSVSKARAMKAIFTTCFSFLSVIVMFCLMAAREGTYNVSHKTAGDGIDLGAIFLIGAVLGITIILLMLYLFVRKILRNDNPEKSFRKTKHIIELAYQPDIGKNDRHAEDNLKKAIHYMEKARGKSVDLKQIDKPLEQCIYQSDVRNETTLIKRKR